MPGIDRSTETLGRARSAKTGCLNLHALAGASPSSLPRSHAGVITRVRARRVLRMSVQPRTPATTLFAQIRTRTRVAVGSYDAIAGDSHNRPLGYNRGMKTTRQLTAIIEREDNAYVALCPELDIASQGATVEIARTNLIEALELFFESADPTEIARRLHSEVFITRVEVAVG